MWIKNKRVKDITGATVIPIKEEMSDTSNIICKIADEIHKEIVKGIQNCLTEACKLNEFDPKIDIKTPANFIVSGITKNESK